MSFRPPAGVTAEAARHIVAANRETFANAFLNGARPALFTVALALAAGAFVATQLRGGRMAK